MRSLAFILVIAATLWAAPLLLGLDPILTALVAVAVTVAVSALAVGSLTPAAIAFGAAGAFAFVAIAPHSHPLGSAVLLAAVFGARALRARTLVWGAVHLVVALVCGAAGAWLVHAYSAQPLVVRFAALGVGALVAAAPLLVPVDDAVSYALRSLAAQASGALRFRLLRAAVLRRRCDGVHEMLSRQARRRMERAWRALVVAARARVDRSRPGGDLLDRRIRAYVSALGRALRAAESASAMSGDLDDKILAELRLEKEDLEARAEGLAEVTRPSSPDPAPQEPAPEAPN